LTKKSNSKATDAGATTWLFGDAEFDEAKWELRVSGSGIELEPRPLEILLCLLRHAGDTVTKEELQHAVWGHSHLSKNALSNAIGKLRKALLDESETIIVTMHKVGYRLAVPVVRREPPPRMAARLGLAAGDVIPGKPAWRLERSISLAPGSEVWLAMPTQGKGGPCVFKFSPDGRRLSSLKREATLLGVLREALGEREDLVQVLDWRFDQPPFFVQCQYGGISLLAWAQSRGGITAMPLAQRLELMAQIADATAAAHSVGVLHKDLKPANVLVDESTGVLRIRLTDFDSGTLTDPSRLAEWGITQHGTTLASPAGTPLYMAPELLLNHSPTVQSDLYSLGVMLYQLVVGDLRRPLASGWERGIDDELLRQDIADAANGDPQRRLTAVGELANRLRQLDARRQECRRVTEQREAEANVRQALDRARARRPWLIAAVAALALGLVISIGFFRAALLSRDEERSEAAIVREINGFLDNDLLAAANPNVGGSMEISVRDAIARAAGKIDNRFAASPEIAATLHQTVGSAYRTLGEYASAEHEFREARRLSYRAFGPAAVLSETSDLLLAQALAYENQYEGAQTLIAPIDTRVLQQTVGDPLIPVRLWDVHTLLDGHRGNRLAAAADAERTDAALRDLQTRHPRSYAANQDFIFVTRLHIGSAFNKAGDSARAEAVLRQLVVELNAARGATDALTLSARAQWLSTLIRQDRIVEAAAYVPQLERDVRAQSSRENPLLLELMQAQAGLAAARKQWNDAVRYSEAVEAGYGRLLGVDNDASIGAMADTAALLRSAGWYEAAVGKYLEAFGLAEKHLSRNGLLTQRIAYGLAASCLDNHQPAQSQIYLSRLTPAALAAADPGRQWNARFKYQWGRVAQEMGRSDEAREDFSQALQAARKENNPVLVELIEHALANVQPSPGAQRS
jgi:non-specific serine/threonine protein kinase